MNFFDVTTFASGIERVCVCVCERERAREKEREKGDEGGKGVNFVLNLFRSSLSSFQTSDLGCNYPSDQPKNKLSSCSYIIHKLKSMLTMKWSNLF